MPLDPTYQTVAPFHHRFGKMWAHATVPTLGPEEHAAVEDWALECGPAFGSEGHVRLVDEIARVLAREESRRTTSRRSLALVVVGLGIELGRLTVADATDTTDVDAVIRLVRRAVADDASGGRRPTRRRQLARVRRPA